jgi:hypothetical protein
MSVAHENMILRIFERHSRSSHQIDRLTYPPRYDNNINNNYHHHYYYYSYYVCDNIN